MEKSVQKFEEQKMHTPRDAKRKCRLDVVEAQQIGGLAN